MRPATLNLPGNQWLLTQNEKFWSWGGKWLLLEFTKILLLSETYRRPIRDLLETDMPHRRPTCLIRDQHASSETHWRPTCLIRDPWSPMGLQSGMLVSDEACRSSIGLWWDLLVSDGSQMRHVGLPMRHIGLRWGMSISYRSLFRHVGLQSGMSISDGSPIIIIFSWTLLIVWESWTCTISIIVQNSGRIRFPGPDQPEKENSTQRHGGVTQFICMNSSIFVI